MALKIYITYRRFLKGGQGTFKKIIENLKNTIEYLPNVSVRINVDNSNYNRITEITDLLAENNLYSVHPYLGHVEPTNDLYDKGTCLTVEEFSNVDFNFSDSIFPHFKDNRYPRLVSNNCCADSINSFVIDPDGNLYKCWSDIGIEEYRIGNICENLKNQSRIYEYALYDVTKDKKCMNCSILPICMGGCPRRRIDNFISNCSYYKYNLENCLQQTYKKLVNKN